MCGILAGFAAVVIWDQSHWWGRRDDYMFGYLVPFFVGYVLFERWFRIVAFFRTGTVPDPDALPPSVAKEPAAKTPDTPNRLGVRFERWAKQPLVETGARWILGIAAGIACLLAAFFFGFGAVLRSANEAALPPSTLAMTVGFAAFVLIFAYLSSDRTLSGERTSWVERLKFVGLFVFPALIWLLSAPLLSAVEVRISLFLLNRVTEVVFFSFDIFGFPLEQQGNVLILPDGGHVGVEDACSGIRSLTACLFAGSFLAAVFLNRLWKKVVMVGMAMFFAFLMNILRSIFLTVMAYARGPEWIDGAVHDITGYAVLGLTCVGLVALLPVFNFRIPELPEPVEGKEG